MVVREYHDRVNILLVVFLAHPRVDHHLQYANPAPIPKKAFALGDSKHSLHWERDHIADGLNNSSVWDSG